MTWYVGEVILLPITFDTDNPLQGTLFGLTIVIRLQRILFSNHDFLKKETRKVRVHLSCIPRSLFLHKNEARDPPHRTSIYVIQHVPSSSS